jgi:hypothetical protein
MVKPAIPPGTFPEASSERVDRRSSIIGISKEGVETEEITEDEFIRRAREDQKDLFRTCVDFYQSYREYVDGLKAEIVLLQSHIEQHVCGEQEGRPDEEQGAGLRERIQELQEAYSQKREANQRLIKKNTELEQAIVKAAIRAAQNGDDREGTPHSQESAAATGRRTAKIDAPPTFTGEDDVTFEYWELRVRDKLSANADHYENASQRLAAVKGWAGGEAAKQLLHRSRPGAANPYKDAEDVIQHLKDIYDDANKVQKAEVAFRKLRMKPSDPFQKFLSDFTYLAQESEQPDKTWKKELYRRLPDQLQKQVMLLASDEGVTFNQFTRQCSTASDYLNEQFNARNDRRAAGGNNNNRNPPQNGNKQKEKDTEKLNPIGGAAKKEKRDRKDITCFKCQEKGHYASECPNGDVKSIELPESDDSGKEEP